MSEIKTIGDVPWSRDDIRASLDEFEALYDKRPIRDNTGGMKAPHMFAVWFMARKLAPETIVESGIWRGQSTWLLEQACPDARIISIDLDLSLRQYISDRAQYSDVDFSAHDWTGIDPGKALVFFDDHQNAYTRVQQCWWFGFRHVIFEDNYPPSQGDCYSCKKAFSGAGFQPALGDTPKSKARLFDRIRYKIASLCGVTWIRMIPQYSRVTIPPNQHDAKYLAAHLQTYYEFPPVFQPGTTRWGDSWSPETYPTPPPILQPGEAGTHPVFFDEALFYTWICYAQLKTPANKAMDSDEE